MSNVKTKVNQEQLEGFFEDHLHIANPTYEMIEGGEISQAYFIETPEGQRVLRFNSDIKDGFLKDAYAADHFTQYGLPIPKVFEVGELDSGVFFCVSEKVPGKVMDKFGVEETNKFMPEFIRVLDKLHAIPPMGEGYGYWRLDGSGKYSSWQESVIDGLHEEDKGLLTSVQFFDQDLQTKLLAKLDTLIPTLPSVRQLIHWDYGFGNVLTDGTRITGIIDWHSSAYGDPLSDIAWLEYWRPNQEFARQFKQYYETEGKLPKDFDNRVQCYMLTAAASSLAFFAKSNQPDKYKFSKDRALELLAEQAQPE